MEIVAKPIYFEQLQQSRLYTFESKWNISNMKTIVFIHVTTIIVYYVRIPLNITTYTLFTIKALLFNNEHITNQLCLDCTGCTTTTYS